MKNSKLIFLLVILVLSFDSTLAQKENTGITADEVINKAIKALGGKDYLLSVNSLYTNMTFNANNQKFNIITKEKTPNKTSTTIYLNDSIVYKYVFNGNNGYQIVDGEKISLSPNKVLKKNIFAELDYLNKSMWEIELLNDDKINGEEAFKISATQSNGIQRILFYSKSTYFLLKSIEFKNKNDAEYLMNDYQAYKKYGKLTFYSILKYYTGPMTQEQKMTELLVNKWVEDADFE